MTGTKVYISGPMTGIEDYNRPAFKAAEVLLDSKGLKAINPANYDDRVEGNQWADFLRKDLHLIAECAALCVLPGWENSAGARLEVHTAFQLGMPIYKLAIAEPMGMVAMMHRTDRIDHDKS